MPFLLHLDYIFLMKWWNWCISNTPSRISNDVYVVYCIYCYMEVPLWGVASFRCDYSTSFVIKYVILYVLCVVTYVFIVRYVRRCITKASKFHLFCNICFYCFLHCVVLKRYFMAGPQYLLKSQSPPTPKMPYSASLSLLVKIHFKSKQHVNCALC